MHLEYLTEALADLDAAAMWYELNRPGLGERFMQAVDATVRRLLAHPMSGRELFFGHRLSNVSGFPYSVVYRIEGESLFIAAVWQAEQNPTTLPGRLRTSEDE